MTDLLEDVLVLTKDHYAHFVVLKMLKYGTKPQRETIIKQFYGQVRVLAVHKEASTVLETAYCDYCSKQQKNLLVQEFYGMEYAKFKVCK
jgi:pumilio family protein 6